MSGVGTAIAIGAGVSAAGAIGGAAISANAAGNAASVQANAAKQAQTLQATEAQNALDFQKQEWGTQQQNEAPFLAAGTQGVNQLSQLLGTPGQGLLAPYGQTFTAPTAAQAEAMPGYQFQLQQGSDALAKEAAATGNLQSGTTGTALQQFGQGLAQTDYGNLYNQALQQYMTNYGVWNQGQTNTYNRLAGLSGIGTQAAANLGQQGQSAAQNTGNIDLTTGAQQGQDINNAAAAQASGIVGSANAFSGALSSIGNTASMLPFYSMLSNQQQQQNASSYGQVQPSPVPFNPFAYTSPAP